MGGGLESLCVGRVYDADGAVRLGNFIDATSIKLPSCTKLAFNFISLFKMLVIY